MTPYRAQLVGVAILTFISVMLIVGISIVIAIDAKDSVIEFDHNISIVLVNRGRERVLYQIKQCRQFMLDPSFKNIVIFSHETLQLEEDLTVDPRLPIITVITVETLETVFLKAKSYVPDIEYILFMGDYTVPVVNVYIADLFSQSRKQRLMINYLLMDSFLMPGVLDVMEPTIPMLLEDAELLQSFDSIQTYMVFIANDSDVVFSGSINQILNMVDNEIADNLTLSLTIPPKAFFQTILAPNNASENLLSKISLIWH